MVPISDLTILEDCTDVVAAFHGLTDCLPTILFVPTPVLNGLLGDSADDTEDDTDALGDDLDEEDILAFFSFSFIASSMGIDLEQLLSSLDEDDMDSLEEDIPEMEETLTGDMCM